MAKLRHRTGETSSPPQQPVSDAAVEAEINGVTYGTRHMNPLKVLKHTGKVFSFMGGQLGALSITKGAAAIAGNLEGLGVIQILQDCFDLASVGGRELGKNNYWQVHFLGKPRELVQVIAWMLEVHFADFFDETKNVALDLFGKDKESPASEGTTQESTSPST